MDPCVYTTQFPRWLEAASARTPMERICFRSGQRWATAAKLVHQYETLPVLFRQQDDSDGPLACRFVAELMEIQFPDRFATCHRPAKLKRGRSTS